MQLGAAHFPTGVSLVEVLQCLAAQSESLGVHHIAAAAHSSLQHYYLPEDQQVGRRLLMLPLQPFISVCKEDKNWHTTRNGFKCTCIFHA